MLILSGNELQTVTQSIVRPLFDRIKSHITLTNNPLHFNCELRWLTAAISTPVLLPDYSSLDGPPDNLYECREPKIVNASIDFRHSRLVCLATGDPAPSVTWSTTGSQQAGDGATPLGVAEASKTRRNSTESLLTVTVSKAGNYTCTAVNLVGNVTATVELTESDVGLLSPPEEDDGDDGVYGRRKRRRETIPILTTPLGFTVTAGLLVLLGFMLRKQ